jgi:hypothetical protein
MHLYHLFALTPALQLHHCVTLPSHHFAQGKEDQILVEVLYHFDQPDFVPILNVIERHSHELDEI